VSDLEIVIFVYKFTAVQLVFLPDDRQQSVRVWRAERAMEKHHACRMCVCDSAAAATGRRQLATQRWPLSRSFPWNCRCLDAPPAAARRYSGSVFEGRRRKHQDRQRRGRERGWSAPGKSGELRWRQGEVVDDLEMCWWVSAVVRLLCTSIN